MFLGLRPISCYTSVSLWNFSVSKSYDLEGLHSLHSFTGTEDESWFYMVPLAIEMVSTPCIQAILDAFEAMHSNQPDLLYDSLKVMETSLSKMVSLLPKMTQKCNPALFFTTLRPFLAGWSHVPPSTSYPEGGVVFEHVHAMPTAWKAQPTLEGCLLHCAGGSAGQTPTIQVLDAFLGIRHASKMYYAMRDYLSTGFHEFIEFVESFEPSLPMYLGHMDRRRSECTQLFNVLIQHLTSFRNLHLKIVAQYIVSQQYKGGLGSSKQAPSLRVHELKGTGNTLLMPFLKETRDETERCILENS
ncbi:hypothetical protein HMI56_004740 [Coelomomyces lativittatus]|nr:hypothetical protein HMI56_004740 [Coelomomyces lativittatus]